MNKYSNKPAKGYERIIQRFYEDLATLTIETFRPVSLICKFLLYFSILCSCRVSCGSPKYPAHNDMRRMNSICIKCRISCGGEMTKNPWNLNSKTLFFGKYMYIIIFYVIIWILIAFLCIEETTTTHIRYIYD